jgi:hypothetical protein
MRPRTCILLFSAVFALLYPLLMWQKGRFLSSPHIMEGITSWFWIGEPLFLALFFFAASTVLRQKILQYACIITASLFLAFASAETYFRLPRNTAAQIDFASHDSVYVKSGHATHLFEKSYSSPDPVLGYGPNEILRIAARRVKDKEVIFDVLYSRNQNGWRITPDRGDKADAAVLLFGCSITIGEGLNDQETFAWRLGEMLGEKFQVFNFGFHGYGAHQMLALVESGRLDALMRRYTRIYASYLTIRGHALRCIGLSPWDQSGPRYVLKNGALKHVGKFSETPEYNMLYQADMIFAHSRAYSEIKEAYRRNRIPDYAVDSHVAIIAKAMHELDVRYNAHAFTVIWPDFLHIEPMLRDHGVRTLPLTDAMPDYASAREKYSIQGDGHPNALANTRIAEALTEYILKTTHGADEQQAMENKR